MTAIPQPSASGLVSDRLSAPLREVAQRQWFVLSAVGVFKTLIVGLGALLAASLLLGFFQHLWMPVRVVVSLLAWAAVIGGAIHFLRPAMRRWSLSRAAMQVEHGHPDIQERLSSAVELSDEKDPQFRGSTSLVAHLVRQAEADAAAVRPDQVVRNDRIVRWALCFVPVLLAWLLLALLPATNHPVMAGLYRVLMPWRNALPALLSDVDVMPKDITLVQGSPLNITARINFHSGDDRQAAHAVLIRKYENGQKISDDMDRKGPRDFASHFDDVQQTFTYMVHTDQGDSSWFTATVHPLPVITGLDLKYDFPPYTGMETKLESNKDGAIEALVGTRVTLTIHTAMPLVPAESNITIDKDKPEQVVIPLRDVQPGKNEYQAQITVSHSGEYKIYLTNEFSLHNINEQPRSIVALPDEVPTIVIQSPEPQVTVRPDDTVPVKYLANDDFGVSKIEAILQVDDHEARTVPVKFKANDKRVVTGPDFKLSVSAALAAQKIADADHITYQLKVTDNRDPDPQFSFSAKQTLKINKSEAQSFQQKIDEKRKQDLIAAIKKAIQELDQTKPKVDQVANEAPATVLRDDQKKAVVDAKNQLAKTNSELDQIADEQANTPFEDVGHAVKKISDTSIKSAADDAGRTELNLDNGQDRKDAATKSSKEITDARTELQKLLDTAAVENAEKKAEAARELADAAKKQQEAAELMKPKDNAAAQTPQEQQQQQQLAQQKQQEATQKTQQAIQQTQELQNAQQQQLAQKLAETIKAVEQLEKQQAANQEQAEKHEAANQIQEQANQLAQQQQDLNKEIQKAAEQNKAVDQQANATPPNKDQQDNIVKQLDQNQLQQAHEAMKAAANQLNQEAQQLQNLANANDLKPTPQQQDALNKDQQAAQAAQNEQAQANQAADALKQEAAQPTKPQANDAGVQKADQAAKDIAQQAAALKPQDAQAQQSAQAAQQDAQAAQQAADAAAQAATPQEAQKDLQAAAADLQKAAQELNQAAQQNAQADKAQDLKDQKAAAQQAADQTKAEAQKQDALAKALEADQQQLAQVQQNEQPLDQAAQQENQLAQATQQADQQAQALQQQAQAAPNSDVAQRAQDAQAALKDAAQQEQAAAKAEQAAQQAEQQAAQAQNAQDAHAAEQKAAEALGQAAAHEQQAEQALAKAENELRNLPDQLAQADAAAQGQPDAGQPDAGQPDQGQPEQGQGDKGQPEQGQGQGQPEQGQGDKGQPEQGQPEQGQGQPEQGQGEKGKGHGHGQHPQSPQQAAQQAAAAAQEAAQAQQEAGQQNPAAAQEAANALAQAAEAMAQAVPGSLHQGQPEQGQPGQEPGHEPGQEPGNDPSNDPSATPGQTPDSKQGIQTTAASNKIPDAVRDIGITADQWAKLPPLVKKDLLNAAQQSGPPTYRQMIKDYYVRIAKIQETGSRGR